MRRLGFSFFLVLCVILGKASPPGPSFLHRQIVRSRLGGWGQEEIVSMGPGTRDS